MSTFKPSFQIEKFEKIHTIQKPDEYFTVALIRDFELSEKQLDLGGKVVRCSVEFEIASPKECHPPLRWNVIIVASPEANIEMKSWTDRKKEWHLKSQKRIEEIADIRIEDMGGSNSPFEPLENGLRSAIASKCLYCKIKRTADGMVMIEPLSVIPTEQVPSTIAETQKVWDDAIAALNPEKCDAPATEVLPTTTVTVDQVAQSEPSEMSADNAINCTDDEEEEEDEDEFDIRRRIAEIKRQEGERS